MTHDLFNQEAFKTHTRDNNPESTETLKINQKSFVGQNKRLLELLVSGKRISFRDAYTVWGISDIRRRSKDLSDIGKFQISKEFIPGTRLKVWFCTPEQIKVNKRLLKNNSK